MVYMGDFSFHNQETILNASEVGIVFEMGFKEKIAEITKLPLERVSVEFKHIGDEEERVFKSLGNLVAEVYLKEDLENGKIIDISPLVDFNQGNYPLGDYRNADFFVLLRDKMTEETHLIFTEITKEGDLLREDAKGIKYKPSEVSLSLTEYTSFERYFEQVYENAKKIYNSLPQRAYGELKKLLQVLIYSADYLLKHNEKLDKLSVMILYPIKDAFITQFRYPYFGNKKLLEEAKEFLREIRNKPIKGKVEEIKGERIYAPKYGIREVRERVGRFIEEKSKLGEVVVLLHAPSSGKTTATLNFVKRLAKNKPVFFLYFTTRIAVAQKVGERLEEKGFKVLKDTKSKYREWKRKYANYTFLEKQGNLASLKREMLKLNPLPRHLALSTTFHSLVRTKYGSTLKHLTAMIEIFKKFYPDAEIVIGIDEILGMEMSFSSYRDLLLALKQKGLINSVRLFVFDASLFSGEIFEEEYNLKTKYGRLSIPPHIIEGEYTERYATHIEEIPHHFEFLPTYPARSLIVKHSELILPPPRGNKKDKTEKLADEISGILLNLDLSEGAGLYIQDIRVIDKITKTLTSRGIDVEIIHSLRKPKFNSVNGKVFIFTSALSRGVDLPVKHFYIIVPSFNITPNLAELLQVFYRLRDGKTDGLYDKKINLLYPISFDGDIEYQRLKYQAIKGLIEDLLEAYISPKSEKIYKIPIPPIKENYFESNLLNYIDIMRQVSIYSSMLNISLNFHLRIDGWTDYQKPQIYYPFAVFPKSDLKINIRVSGELEEIKARIENDNSIPAETKLRLLEFLNGFKGSYYSLNTSSQFAIFLPNLIIPTPNIGKELERLNLITRLGYRVYPFKVMVDNKLIGKIFPVYHDWDLIGFFPSDTIGNFVPLPLIPLIFLR